MNNINILTMNTNRNNLNEEVNKIKKIMNIVTEQRKYEYGCVMLYFNFKQIKDIHDLIDSDDLYHEDGEDYGLETEPHCTLLFGLKPEVSLDEVKEVLKEFTFSNCEAHNASLFKNEKYDVFKFDIKGDNLSEANKKLKEFPYVNEYKTYHPHMTIAYVKPGEGRKYCDKIKDDRYELTPKYAVYSQVSGKKSKISIKVD